MSTPIIHHKYIKWGPHRISTQCNIAITVKVIIVVQITWKCKMSSCRLVGDPVADDVEMLLESFSKGSMSLSNILLLTFGAGYNVDNMF